MKLNIYLMFILILNGCSGFLGHRSFVNKMDRQNDYQFFEPEKDFNVVAGDTGRILRNSKEIQNRMPASKKEARLMNEEKALSNELSKLERSLEQDQYDSYSKIKKLLSSRGQKIYYLKLLPSERSRYLKSLGIGETYGQYYRKTLKSRSMYELSGLYNLPELQEGMQKSDVEGVWGNPVQVEIAGNPSNQNEKWTFYQNGKSNIVYFENGQVQGWELH